MLKLGSRVFIQSISRIALKQFYHNIYENCCHSIALTNCLETVIGILKLGFQRDPWLATNTAKCKQKLLKLGDVCLHSIAFANGLQRDPTLGTNTAVCKPKLLNLGIRIFIQLLSQTDIPDFFFNLQSFKRFRRLTWNSYTTIFIENCSSVGILLFAVYAKKNGNWSSDC